MEQQFVLGLEESLTKVVNPQDSATMRDVTAALNKHFYSTPQSVPALVEIISRSTQPPVRQLASVELRKRVRKWWSEIPDANKDVLRGQLITIYLNEQQGGVRRSVAQVFYEIANHDVPDNKWPGLLTFLHESISSSNVIHREAGSYCLYTIFELVGDQFTENTAPLFESLNKSIVDPESKNVRKTTVLTLGKLAEFIEMDQKDNIRMFKEMIPSMVNVLQQYINENDEENAGEIFEVFDTLLMQETPLLSDHLEELIRFFLQVGGKRELNEGLRIMALSFLMWAAIYKQNRIRSLKLVDVLVQNLMPIGTEEDPEDADEDSPSRLSFKVINALATNMPPQQVFPVVMPVVVNYMQSSDRNYRKAAMMGFAVIVDGCAEFMSPKLGELLPIVCSGLRDPDVIVRRAGCMALGSLAEELSAEILEHHQVLLPLVFDLLNDSNPRIIKQACDALDAILKGLSNEILPYLPMLMKKLLLLLDSSTSTDTKATVIAAIGSAAQAAGESFQPYFDEVLPRIRYLMSLKEQDDKHHGDASGAEGTDNTLLRGVATDAAGAIAEAVGRDLFRPYTSDLMTLAIEQLELQSPRLRECSYAFFAIIARVFEEDFAPYLQTIMPHILTSCSAEEKDDTLESEAEISLDDGDDDDDGASVFRFNTAIAYEKEVAVDALGELFENTRTHFLPYVDKSLEELKPLAVHISDGVRTAVAGSLFSFLRTFFVISGQQGWNQGLPVSYPVHENVKKMTDIVLPTILEMWEEEVDRMVAVQICQQLIQALKQMGPSIIADHVENISDSILDIFMKKSECQQTFDDGDVDDDEEAESESILISSAADLVVAMCEVLGDQYAPRFDVYLPFITKYCKKTKSASERSMAIGCLGECITGIKSAVTNHTDRLLELFLKGCVDEDQAVKSNSAFALGVLATYTKMDLSSKYPEMLTTLYPLFTDTASRNTVDNAAGAVARLTLARMDAVPLDQVLPVFTNVLPLKADYAENEPVFECIFKLFEVQNAFVMNHLPQFLQLFIQVLSDEEQLTEATRARLIELVRALNASSPELSVGSSELARFL